MEQALQDAIDRLSATVERITTRKPVDPAADIELDADKVAARRTAGQDGEIDWKAAGDKLGEQAAKAIEKLLERFRPYLPSNSGSTSGGSDSSAAPVTVPQARPKNRLTRFLGRYKVGRAGMRAYGRAKESRVGRAVSRVGGAVAGSWLGRRVGMFGGPVGMIAGGLIGGAVGGAMGARSGSTSRGGVAGGATGAILGGVLGGPAGALGGGVAGAALGAATTGFVKATTEMSKAAEENTRKLRENNDALGRMSGLLNLVNVEGQIRDDLRSRQIGDRLAGSARFLQEGDQFRKENRKEVELLSARLDNNIGAIQNYVAAMASWPINKIAAILNRAFPGDENTQASINEMISNHAKRLAKEDVDAKDRIDEFQRRKNILNAMSEQFPVVGNLIQWE